MVSIIVKAILFCIDCTVLIDVVSIIDKAILYCFDRCGQLTRPYCSILIDVVSLIVKAIYCIVIWSL